MEKCVKIGDRVHVSNTKGTLSVFSFEEERRGTVVEILKSGNPSILIRFDRHNCGFHNGVDHNREPNGELRERGYYYYVNARDITKIRGRNEMKW